MANARVQWNSSLEKGLVDLLLEYNIFRYRGQNEWTTEGWNRIVDGLKKKFFKSNLTKQQVKKHEAQMKRDYKTIKNLRNKSGMAWDHIRGMLVTSHEVWASLIKANPKLKKWQHKLFMHYDALASLYEENIAEGQKNFTSIRSRNVDLRDNENEEPASRSPPIHQSSSLADSYEEGDEHRVKDEDFECTLAQSQLQCELHATSQHVAPSISPSTVNRKKKRPTGERIADVMERYMKFREGESSREKEVTNHGDDFSIPKCIEVLNNMEGHSIEEKALAANVFIQSYNREIFLSL